MSAPARPRRSPASRFAPLSRIWAMLVKEFIQLLRDRVTLATMVSVPLMQLFLFGFAINTTPRHMPAGVLLQEQSDVGRSVLEAMQHTDFFDFKLVAKSEAEIDAALRSGDILFAVEIPAGFERALRRGETPALLFVADATDPVASASALGALSIAIINSPTAREGIEVAARFMHVHNPALTVTLTPMPRTSGHRHCATPWSWSPTSPAVRSATVTRPATSCTRPSASTSRRCRPTPTRTCAGSVRCCSTATPTTTSGSASTCT